MQAKAARRVAQRPVRGMLREQEPWQEEEREQLEQPSHHSPGPARPQLVLASCVHGQEGRERREDVVAAEDYRAGSNQQVDGCAAGPTGVGGQPVAAKQQRDSAQRCDQSESEQVLDREQQREQVDRQRRRRVLLG